MVHYGLSKTVQILKWATCEAGHKCDRQGCALLTHIAHVNRVWGRGNHLHRWIIILGVKLNSPQTPLSWTLGEISDLQPPVESRLEKPMHQRRLWGRGTFPWPLLSKRFSKMKSREKLLSGIASAHARPKMWGRASGRACHAQSNLA